MKKYFFAFLLFIHYQFASAQIGAQSTFEFLRMPVSSHAIALGGLLPAYQQNDLSVAVAAPSLLNQNLNKNFSLNQEILFAGIIHGQAAYALYNKKTDATFAGSIQYINYGNFIRADETGRTEGKFGAEEICLQMGFGKALNPKFSYGANAKFITSRFDNLIATGVAADLSTTYSDTAKKIMFTIQIKNFGATLKNYQPRSYLDPNYHETLPTDLQMGISKKLTHIPLALHIVAHHLTQADIRYFNSADNVSTSVLNADTSQTKTKKYIADKIFRHLNFGTEFYFGKSFSVQIGYSHLRRQELKTTARNGLIGFSGGFQIKTKRFTIGYARAWYYLPSASNTLSISFLI